jgi:hypothetical protein
LLTAGEAAAPVCSSTNRFIGNLKFRELGRKNSLLCVLKHCDEQPFCLGWCNTKQLGHTMNHQQAALQDREIINAQTARQFHLNAIEHLEKAMALHRKAVGNHDQGDFATAAQNTALAQAHVGSASEHTVCATKHYCEQKFYK